MVTVISSSLSLHSLIKSIRPSYNTYITFYILLIMPRMSDLGFIYKNIIDFSEKCLCIDYKNDIATGTSLNGFSDFLVFIFE